VNPGNAPLVVGQLLDDECPEDFIKGLILSVRSLLPVEPLVDECEKRLVSHIPPSAYSNDTHPPSLPHFYTVLICWIICEPGTAYVCSLNSWST
jgi:hypothetical protein